MMDRSTLLNTLRDHHNDLLLLIARQEEATLASKPDIATIAAVRLKLSRANTVRSGLLFETILPEIAKHASAGDRVRIEDLKKKIAQRIFGNSDYVRQWSYRTIELDWEGYKRASEHHRAVNIVHVKDEQALLYPLLDPVEALRSE